MSDHLALLSRLDAVLLLHGYRTGSNYIASVLANNLIGEPAEFFNRGWQASVQDLSTDALQREACRTIGENSRHGIFSAKLPLQDFLWLAKSIGTLDDPVGSVARRFRRCAVVFVSRRDIFLQSVSLWRAWQTGEWYRYKRVVEKRMPPDYDRDGIYQAYLYLCREEYLWRELIARSGIDPICVAYEEFENNPDRIRRILTQLIESIGDDRFKNGENLQIVTGNAIQRDELSYEQKQRFIADLVQSYTAPQNG